ncbi:adenosylcobinamide-GDP ribazoletransferase [Pelagibius sp.]|uniref:adenosylcobinamide-GDP ribazoletransferase n=1 Tax=Pelagibius sp. TaxID=1931238 RepID=UPI00261D0505|nr:adenosylcobinamide-GDP ribazoletransferase [Pelagibius sp.]
MKVALTLLTRLPVPQPPAAGASEMQAPLARASRCYPVVGALIGALGGLALLAADALQLPALIAALLAVAATILATGALHEDGLADVADGFGGGRDRARKLAIMRDSRIGSYGVLALVFSVALRSAALAAIAAVDAGQAAIALLAAQCLSRAGLGTIMAGLPGARADGLAAAVGRPRGADALAAAAVGVLAAVLLLPWHAAALALLGAAAASAGVAVLARRQIGGYTGDVLGAAQQLSEIAVLLVLAALLA